MEVWASHRPQVKVLILPFKMHAEGDISARRRNIMETLAGSLVAEGIELVGIEAIREKVRTEGAEGFDEADAIELAKKVRADFAIIGSLTKIDRIINADWKVMDLRDFSIVAFYFKSAGSEAELKDWTHTTAPQIFDKMMESLKIHPAEQRGTIDRIVISGNRRIDTEAVTRNLKSAEGKPFNPDDIRGDIKALFGMGYFDDITVDLSDTASGKVLTFNLKELPFIRKIEFSGNKEVKDETISGVVTLKENTVLDRSVLAENTERIRALYADEGFYLASIEPIITTDGLDATITFKIEENEEVKVKRITFIGNKFFSSNKLLGFISTKEKDLLSTFTGSGKFNDFLFQNDLSIILSKYYDYGFIEAEIVDHRVLLSSDKKYFIITISISEGEQFRVGSLDVKGEILTSREDILDELGLNTGEIFNRSKMGKGLEKISELYGDKGYAYAEIKPLNKINKDDRTIDLTLDIKKNELVYIERIDISGNVRTRDKVIRRELELEEGKLFSSSGLKRSRNNLRRLGYFEEVRLAQTQGSASDKMKLDVNITERPTGSVSLGVGYSSVDKLIGTASISQANFMGTGVRLDLSGTVSGSSSRYVLSVTEPWLFDKPISAGFDLYNTEKTYPDFEIRKNGGGIRFGFPVWKRYTKLHLTYKLEDVNIFNVSTTASSFIKDQEGQTTESSVKALLRHDTRNDAFFPSDGEVLTASVEFAGGPIGGTSFFIKYEGEAVKYFALPWETVFSIKGALGYVQGYQDHAVPIYERYFLGGINSIRGFETRTVGPKDPVTGEFIGGNYMMVGNLEFIFPIFSQQNMRGVLFFDAGNAYKGNIDFDDIRYGAGAGIRWFSPIGPLRLELGFNLDRRDDEKSQQWEFAVGTLF